MNGAVSGGEAKQPIHVNRRKENADALADLAIENFIEMRDKTASRAFRAKKKLDHLLEYGVPEAAG